MLETSFVAPQTATQRAICDIWGEILSIAEVGLDDNFFMLGGDSLHMTQISSRIRDSLNVELSFDDFFSHPTVASLSKIADTHLEQSHR